ncbi:MAG: DNA cytosine methyltransferase [Candidatus Paceibacterota bacterium]
MKNVFDSFAGAGGFSLGFAQAGFNIVGANEIDNWACQTFQHNHPTSTVIEGDITEIPDSKLLNAIPQQIDILLGGPPCQGFSIANSKGGDPKDPRNSLFKEFLRLGKVFKPSVIVMENVPNIIKAKTSEGEFVVDIIESELQALGYFTEKRVLQATDYGVPQIRRRFILVGTLKKIDKFFPEPTHGIDGNLLNLPRCPTLWEAISDLPSIEAGEASSHYASKPKNEYQRLLRDNGDSLQNHSAMRHSKRLVERFKSMTWGQKGDELSEAHMPLKRNGKGEKSGSGYSQNNRRMYPDKPCHTIAASFYANFVHPYDDRNFTPREGARVQSFPDSFTFLGKPTTPSHSLLAREGRYGDIHLGQYNQIGNAVPPMMARALAENLKRQLSY